MREYKLSHIRVVGFSSKFVAALNDKKYILHSKSVYADIERPNVQLILSLFNYNALIH